MSRLLTHNILTNDSDFTQSRLLIALMNKDIDKLVAAFNQLLAGIPYDDFTKAANDSISLSGSKMTAREWLYRSTLLAFVRGCGVVATPEAHSNLGQADLVLAHKGVTWVIEIKVAKEGQKPEPKAKRARKQMKDKNYATQYDNAVSVVLVIDDTVRQTTKSIEN
jgi:hypothetical protein